MPARSSDTEGPLKSIGFGAALIFFLALVVYFPALNGQFLWDDDVLVYNNELNHRSDGLKLIWQGFQTPDYFPLTLTTLWLEWRLWGMQTVGYHVGNLFLHALGAVLLWRVLQKLKVPGAFVGALIFTVHPVCVASVAWIAERKNTLSLVFFLLSVLCYLRSEETNASTAEPAIPPTGSPAYPLTNWRLYFLSLAFFLLALFSKTSVVMLPVILLGCALWQRGRIQKGDVWRTLPFFVCSLVLGLVTVWFQTHRAIGFKSDPALVRIAGGGWAVWFYLFKAILPAKLSMIYPKWDINPASVIAWLPWLAWLGALGTCWKFRKSWGRPVLFACGYCFITVLPVLGFFDMSFFAFSRAADHLNYLSIIGIAALAGALLTEGFRKQKFVRPGKPAFRPLAAIVIGVLCVLSWQRAQVFAVSERLWSDTLKKNPKAWAAYNNLGEAILERGGDLSHAMQLFQSAVRLRPDYPEAHNNIGNAYSDQKQFAQSYPHYAKALEVWPDYAEAENNWGLALARDEQVDEAITHFQKALKHAPRYAHAHYNLGIALVRKGKLAEAEESYRAALRGDPNYVDARLNLAMVLADLKKFEEAETQYNETIRQAPDLAEAYNGLGIVMIDKKNFTEAVRCFREAVRLDPQNPNLQRNLDRALEKMAKSAG